MAHETRSAEGAARSRPRHIAAWREQHAWAGGASLRRLAARPWAAP